MGATHRKRRRITVDGELFLWSLHEEDLNTLHVLSQDKQLNLRYGWQHSLPPEERYVDVMGRRFAGLPPGLPGWIRVQAPDWTGFTYEGSPRFVRVLIRWALAPKPEIVYKLLPPGYSTHILLGSPWGLGIPTFHSSPGEARTRRLTEAAVP
jgi:hypothetical protein